MDEAAPTETSGGAEGQRLGRRDFLGRAGRALGFSLAASVLPGLAAAAPPETPPLPAPGKKAGTPDAKSPTPRATATPTPTRPRPTPTELIPPSPSPSPTPEATATPEPLPPIRFSYENFAHPNDSMGRQPVAETTVDRETEALGAYLDNRETRQAFPNLSSQLNVYGIRVDVGPHAGQDWFFVEDLGSDRGADSDNRYWFWYGEQLWPMSALNGQAWGVFRDEGRVGVAINRNGEWTYPTLQQLGIDQIIAGTARHPSAEATQEAPAAPEQEVAGAGFRWERKVDPGPEEWNKLIGTTTTLIPQSREPFNFKHSFQANIHWGIIEAAETLEDGQVRVTFNAGGKGRMTILFQNGQPFTAIYNMMHNGQVHPDCSGVVTTPNFPITNSEHGALFSRNIGCRSWPVRQAPPGEATKADGIHTMDVASEIGQVVGFRIPDEFLPKVGEGAVITSNVIVTTGGDWDAQP